MRTTGRGRFGRQLTPKLRSINTRLLVIAAGTLLLSGVSYAGLLPSAELLGGTSGNVIVPLDSEGAAGQLYPTGTVYQLSSPGTYAYGDSFSDDPPDITGIPNLQPGISYNFYDDFFIQIPTASVDSLTSSVNLDAVLGLTNLDARLYSLTSNPGGLVLGTPVGDAIEGWGESVSPGGDVSEVTQLIGPVTLFAGDYVLEVRAQTDEDGGSYSGVINLSPVPLPGSLPLMLSGMALAGALALRRRAAI